MKTPTRSPAFVFGALLLGVLGQVRSAWAQHCQPPSPRHGASATSWDAFASVRGEAATYRIGPDEGSYEGLFLAVGGGTRWLRGELRAPAYRLVRGGTARYGAGDPLLRARVVPLRGQAGAGQWELGASFGASLPVGDPDQGLGMGHVMLLPSVFATLQMGRWSSALEVTVARALEEHEHGGAHGGHAHHHHAPHATTTSAAGPLVEPMTSAEVAVGAATFSRVAAAHGVRTGTHAAFPLDGPVRWYVLFGPELRPGPFAIAAEWHLPLLGEPFSSKIGLELRGSF